MTLLEILGEWRSQLADEEEKYLWSNDEALRWLIDAQDKFVRLTDGILDSTTAALTDLPLIANNPWVAYNPLILRIRDTGQLLTAKYAVKVANRADIEQMRVWDYGMQRILAFDDADIGTVHYAVTGMEENKIRLVSVPAVNDTLRLSVFRLPYPRITEWSETVPLEIDERHHLDLVWWMKYRAYSKHDSETYDKNLAAECKANFEAYCAEAKSEKERRNFKPRAVRYGGI